jgi:hypothetical protein
MTARYIIIIVVRPQQLQHQQHRQKLIQQSTTAIAKIRKSNDENFPWFQKNKRMALHSTSKTTTTAITLRHDKIIITDNKSKMIKTTISHSF